MSESSCFGVVWVCLIWLKGVDRRDVCGNGGWSVECDW